MGGPLPQTIHESVRLTIRVCDLKSGAPSKTRRVTYPPTSVPQHDVFEFPGILEGLDLEMLVLVQLELCRWQQNT